MPIVLDPFDQPVEVAPGRGDLTKSSMPFDSYIGSPFWQGRPISYAKMFATQPWVAVAVMRLLTWSIRVPLKVYRRIDDDHVIRLRPKDHRLAAAVRTPWDRGSMADLTMALLGPLLVHGNDLTDVQDGAGDRLRFDPLDWRTVIPIRLDENDPDSEIQGWRIWRGATRDERSADTVMHLKWWSPLGQIGISPLEQVRSSVLSDTAAIEWAMNSLANGFKPTGVVELDEYFLGRDPAERQVVLDNARKDMVRAYGGPLGAGTIPVFPAGVKLNAVKQTTAVEAELIQQRLVYRNEVAAIYMIPPPMIGHLEKASYNNISTQREMAYTDGLAPPLVLIEQKLNAHVVTGLLREDDIFVEYDFAGILRGDRLKEIQALREAIGSGLMAPNEGRDVLNLPRSSEPRADELWMPWNNTRPMNDPPPQKGSATSSTGTGRGAKAEENGKVGTH
jgi:HK97 family phage portal protein